MSTKAERGTKRTCQNPECGSRFYDLNRDPIVCPTCQTAFKLSMPADAQSAVPTGQVAGTRAAARRGSFAPVEKPAVVPAAEDEEDALPALEGEERMLPRAEPSPARPVVERRRDPIAPGEGADRLHDPAALRELLPQERWTGLCRRLGHLGLVGPDQNSVVRAFGPAWSIIQSNRKFGDRRRKPMPRAAPRGNT